MAFKRYNNFGDEVNTELVYDLRQTYAQILDEVLKRIATQRYLGNFAEWFNALDDLHIEVWQKLLDEERTEYKDELKKCVAVLNKYPNVFNKTDKNNENIFRVKTALTDLEKWLRDKMEEHAMFGLKEDEDDGL